MSQKRVRDERKRLRKLMRRQGISPESIKHKAAEMAAHAVIGNFKPRRRWLPRFIWRWLLLRFLYQVPLDRKEDPQWDS